MDDKTRDTLPPVVADVTNPGYAEKMAELRQRAEAVVRGGDPVKMTDAEQVAQPYDEIDRCAWKEGPGEDAERCERTAGHTGVHSFQASPVYPPAYPLSSLRGPGGCGGMRREDDAIFMCMSEADHAGACQDVAGRPIIDESTPLAGEPDQDLCLNVSPHGDRCTRLGGHLDNHAVHVDGVRVASWYKGERGNATVWHQAVIPAAMSATEQCAAMTEGHRCSYPTGHPRLRTDDDGVPLMDGAGPAFTNLFDHAVPRLVAWNEQGLTWIAPKAAASGRPFIRLSELGAEAQAYIGRVLTDGCGECAECLARAAAESVEQNFSEPGGVEQGQPRLRILPLPRTESVPFGIASSTPEPFALVVDREPGAGDAVTRMMWLRASEAMGAATLILDARTVYIPQIDDLA